MLATEAAIQTIQEETAIRIGSIEIETTSKIREMKLLGLPTTKYQESKRKDLFKL